MCCKEGVMKEECTLDAYSLLIFFFSLTEQPQHK